MSATWRKHLFGRTASMKQRD
ncbi:unnamed protein product, partial [Rotaria sp. Silwood1]